MKHEWYVDFALLGVSAVIGYKPMEQPSSHVIGLLIQTSLFIHTMCMSRVLKPFYNNAVSLFYSLIKIATNVFFSPVQYPFHCISVLLYRPINQLEVNYKTFHIPFFPQVLNKGSKNGYCFSNVCFIFKIFLLLDIKIWC